jgi:hypothetical protein
MISDMGEDRWAHTGIRDVFFDTFDAAREAVVELRSDIDSDPEMTWSPTRIEKIETLPVSAQTILALLNDGMGAFIKKYEIIETIG